MHIAQGNPTKKSLLIFAITLCIYSLYTAAEIRLFSHNEEEIDYGPTIPPIVWGIRSYDDGTVVARITRRNTDTSTATKICFHEVFSLRIIYSNGTVDEKDFNLDIPQFNHCYLQNGTKVVEFLDYHLIRKNHILVTYYMNVTNFNDIYTYEEWGMIIDFDGNVLNRTLFGIAFINVTTNQLMPDRKIRLNINREKGFLRLARVADIRNPIEWQQYKVEPDGIFTKLTNGTLGFDDFSSLICSIVSTVDEAQNPYANTTNNYIKTDPLLPQGQLFILPIKYNQMPFSSLLLYQSPLPGLNFPALTCDVILVGVGHVCVLTVSQKGPAGLPPDKKFFVKINFLSSGSVTTSTVINHIFSNVDNNLDIVLEVNSLPFGGYLLTKSFNDNQNNHLIYGFLFSNDTNYIAREFPTNSKGTFHVLHHNNTLLVAQMETDNNWQFQVIDLPKFVNSNVKATFPEIQSSINFAIPKISIDFYNPVELSDGKLSIYIVMLGWAYLRQSIPAVLCFLENDGRTVSADVLENTFSVEGHYFIKVDNNFVRDRVYEKPLLGIRDHVWNFTIESFLPYIILNPIITGKLRLTSEGTRKFDSFSPLQRYNFFKDLESELFYTVLRLVIVTEKTQLDKSLDRYLISISIKTYGNYDVYTSTIKYIDIMVRNKDQSQIGLGKVTRYLDESYGFTIPEPNFWREYKSFLTFLFIIVGIMIGSFLFARRRSKNNNTAIFHLGLIIIHWILDAKTTYISAIIFILRLESETTFQIKEGTSDE